MPQPSAANIYEINPLTDSRWETFVDRHPLASVFHRVQWLRALKATYGYEPLVVTSCTPGVALTNGLVYCRVRSWLTGPRLVSLPFSDHCEPLLNKPADLDGLLWKLKQRVEAGEWKYLEIRPVQCQPGSRTGLTQSITYSLHSLKLQRSTEELFRNFHKNCVQRKIRRAEREKLRYEEGTSDALIEKFYELIVSTRKRQFLPPQPLAWFRSLVAAFGENVKVRLASKNDQPVAAILTLVHKSSMVYKYGASDARFHNLGGTSLLLWNAIQEAKNRGFEEFEMGRSDTSNQGLIQYKEHWGTSGKPITYWTYPCRPHDHATARQKAILRRIVPLVPAFALKATGALLYRHAG